MEGRQHTIAPIRVLIVEDEELHRMLVRRYLDRAGIEIVGEMSSLAGLTDRVRELRPDIVLMDFMLPDGTGDDATAAILDAFPNVRVLAMTASEMSDSVSRMISAGASGFVFKRPEALRKLADDVRSVHRGEIVLAEKAAADVVRALAGLERESRDTSARLQFTVEALQVQLDLMGDVLKAVVQALADFAETRDEYTAGHLLRVKDYSIALAEVIDPLLAEDEYVFGYILHDIGKLAVRDELLKKPGALTDAEYEEIKRHPTAGAEVIGPIPFLHHTLDLVRHHHERWDGKGYPDRLAGEEIPLIARLFAVADALDAITTDRPYRSARPLDFAVAEFRKQSGTQFDPFVVAVFAELVESHPTFERLRLGEVPGRPAP